MSLSLEMSRDALASIRAIQSEDARRGIKKVIDDIQENPVERSMGFSLGVRFCDGYFHVGRMAYAYEVDYEHDDEVVSILRVKVEVPGPH